MNLLVAEDNDLNWEIVRELLGVYGIVCTRALDGRACVAARTIRGHERAAVRELPIVAKPIDMEQLLDTLARYWNKVS